MKVFEAFAGYGSQRLALKRLNLKHESVGISEIDSRALKAYTALHGETPNYGDITEITEVPAHDLFTYSFPCQDISLAGLGQGLKKDSNTRSSTLWACEHIIREYRPSVLLLENVKALVGKRYKEDLELWLKTLENLGYTNHVKVLNSIHFGIPQNRERVFVVSTLNQKFEFPEEKPLAVCLRDFLDERVPEDCFLSDIKKKQIVIRKEDITEETDKIVLLGGIPETKNTKKIRSDTSIYSILGVSPTIRTDTKSPVIFDDEYGDYRRLSATECFRLMGLNESEVQQVCLTTKYKTHLYFLAGNSIVVPVLEGIFRQLYS